MSAIRIKASLWMGVLCAGAIAAAEPSQPKSQSEKEGTPKIHTVTEVQTVSTLTDKESGNLYFSAGRVVKHVEQARAAIRSGNSADAAAHVDQALKLMAIVERLAPRRTIRTEIVAGDLAYVDQDEVAAKYVMIFDEQQRHDIITPIVAAKKSCGKNCPQNAAGNSPTSGTTPTDEKRHSKAMLDVVHSLPLLNQVRDSLQAGRTAEADEGLLAFQSSCVLLECNQCDLPLADAADQIKLAEFAVQEGRYAEARTALHEAVAQLQQYEKSYAGRRGVDVQDLRQEIIRLNLELEVAPPSLDIRQEHSSRISEFWNRSAQWMNGNDPIHR